MQRPRTIFSPSARRATGWRSSPTARRALGAHRRRSVAGRAPLVVLSPMTATSPPTRYKIGLVQMAMSADPEANLHRAIAELAEAAAAGARLVCLPALFRLPYFPQREVPAVFDLAGPVPRPGPDPLAQAAQPAGVV